MTKLFNCSFREQEGKYFIDGYTFQKPLKEKFTPCLYSTFEEFLSAWQKSKKSIEVHESQVEGFMELARKSWSRSRDSVYSHRFNYFLKQGIEIPDGMVEIKYLHNLNFGAVKYAFLKPDTIKSQTNCPTCGSKVKVGGMGGSTHYYIPVEEESKDQDELFLRLLNDLDIWSKSCKGSLDISFMIQALKSKFTITKK